MSRFFSARYKSIEPRLPEGQFAPEDDGQTVGLLRLDTIELPFPPSPKVTARLSEASASLHRRPEPDCPELTEEIAKLCGAESRHVLVTDGADEALDFAFKAFCDRYHPAAFPEIGYDAYRTLADVNGIPYKEIPLRDDLTIRADDYIAVGRTIFIADPNVPMGLAMPSEEIEGIARRNPDNVVVLDEAYLDLADEGSLSLIHGHDNILIVRSLSKTRPLAGARLGFCVGPSALIKDLKIVRDRSSPHGLSRLAIAAGMGTLEDVAYDREMREALHETRAFTADALEDLGFVLTGSIANFLFARHPRVDGGALHTKLMEAGICVKHFDVPALAQYERITIGTRAQMEELVSALKKILGEDD